LPFNQRVLYLALEDIPVRLKNRLQKLGIVPTTNFKIATEWLPNEGGIKALEKEVQRSIADEEAYDCVIIDTKGALCRATTETGYQADYDFYTDIKKRITDKFGISCIVITHNRKMPSVDDEFDSISGSVGSFGCVDTGLVLKNNRFSNTNEARLFCTSRDFPEYVLPLRFSAETCMWTKMDESEINKARTREQERLVEIIRTKGSEMSPSDISKLYGTTAKNVSNLLNNMTKNGLVLRGSKSGLWTLPEFIKAQTPMKDQNQCADTHNTFDGHVLLNDDDTPYADDVPDMVDTYDTSPAANVCDTDLTE
jgi:hypothetical protein